MKKNRIFILGIVTMFVAILSLTLVSGTLARYTSTGTGTDTVTVALWDVQYKDNTSITDPAQDYVQVNGSNGISFNLFNTIKDSNMTDVESDVVAGKIAPGTSGSFNFLLKNSSEVNAKYSVTYTAEEAGIPLQWSLDGTNWKENLHECNVADVAINMGTSDASITVYWKWAFNGDNAVDTGLGLNPKTATVGITVTFDQVD